jgi:hypothetical protein
MKNLLNIMNVYIFYAINFLYQECWKNTIYDIITQFLNWFYFWNGLKDV